MSTNLTQVADTLMQSPTYAGDESGWQGRCEIVGVQLDEASYREFFVRAVARSSHGSIILHRNTIAMKMKIDGKSDGKSFPEFLEEHGKSAGMKVDAGTFKFGDHLLVGSVADLDKRCAEAKANGCVFTKFRFPFDVDTPSGYLGHGAEQLCAYCVKSLEHGLVPYPEPELVRDGSHSIDQCETQMKRMFELFMAAAYRWQIPGEAVIVKTNVIEPGSKVADSCTTEEVARRTAEFFKPLVRAFAGIKLLSGGQPAPMAFARTSAAVAKLNGAGSAERAKLSTSFSRAAMDGVLERYRDEGMEAAADLFVRISEQNMAACQGK